MNQKKRINLKIMETLTKKEHDQLLADLGKIEDFEFFIVSQLLV